MNYVVCFNEASEPKTLYVIDSSVSPEGSTNISRADPPWGTQPTSNSPPPPWEPPVDPWDGPQKNVPNLNAAEWPAGTGEFICGHSFKDKYL